MKLLWNAIVEKYEYSTKDERQMHKRQIIKEGYEDTGLVIQSVPGEDGIYRRVLCGEYRKYITKRQS